jgi:choline dehydrogenase-like flavoprotein
LFGVHGDFSGDPTEPPRSAPLPYGAVGSEPFIARVSDKLAGKGLHPFPLPVAVDLHPGASAFGAAPAPGFRVRPAARTTPRHDASNPPLATGRVTLWTGARARRLILSPDGRRVEAIEVAHEGEFKRVSAEIVVLASGAVNSAAQCGSIRMGATPEEAPLEQYCRSFDHCNLYVVDASFFPSSGALNPALTVAGQAIRVADRIAKIELKMSR